MMGQNAGDGIHERGTALKRRGILAAAGVVVAGIVAKQSAQPVLAASLVLDTDQASAGNTNIHGPGAAAPWASVAILDPILSVNNTSGSPHDGVAAKAPGYAIYGETAGYAGVFGVATPFGIGIRGESASSTGVYGQSGGGSSTKGVHGKHLSNGYGVYGETGAFGYGVTGVSPDGIGVVGQSTSGTGVQGQSTGGTGVYGLANAAGTTQVVAGVFGDSTTTYGIIGRTTASGYSGLTAITGTPGVAALAATSTSIYAYAAYFQGTTVVQGDFVAFGGVKSAAVKDATGQHRLVYCMESPEAWFEDFGKAKLVNGKADVALDPIFAQIAYTDDYHVFLTTYGESNGLYVTGRSAGGFAVQERGKGASSIGFSYRVVAKRADIKGERLAKFDLPKIRIPDESQLPKPVPPKAAPSPLPPTKP